MVTGDLHGHQRNFNLIWKLAAVENPAAISCSGGLPRRSDIRKARLHVRDPEDVACENQISSGPFILGNHELAERPLPIQKNRQMLNLQFGWDYGRCMGWLPKVLTPIVGSGEPAPSTVQRLRCSSHLARGCQCREVQPVGPHPRTHRRHYGDRATLLGWCGGRDYRGNARAFAQLVEPKSSSMATSRVTKLLSLRTSSRSSWIAVASVQPT